MNTFQQYACDGLKPPEREARLQPQERNNPRQHPAHYIAEAGLINAVNVALALGQPLLLTGEPGTGKTELARSVAYELGWPRLTFHTKTTSAARDLFYQYDTLRHFHDAHLPAQPAQAREALNAEDYISYEALGMAILLADSSLSATEAQQLLPSYLCELRPTKAVVLIDEIDKAPRDLPNDVLHEIENLAFQVRETRREFSASRTLRPLVILTSNSEKNLPDAFLRRCIFYHIQFPNEERLKQIVHKRFGEAAFAPARLDQALAHFASVRKKELKKNPATAELLAWLDIVERLQLQFDKLDEKGKEALRFSYSVLAKNKDDLEKLSASVK